MTKDVSPSVSKDLSPTALAQFLGVLVVGVAGSLGALALGNQDLAGMILAFSGGLLVPLASPFKGQGQNNA